jgi:hypothetical protein
MTEGMFHAFGLLSTAMLQQSRPYVLKVVLIFFRMS